MRGSATSRIRVDAKANKPVGRLSARPPRGEIGLSAQLRPKPGTATLRLRTERWI
jgi:hypothetical protein